MIWIFTVILTLAVLSLGYLPWRTFLHDPTEAGNDMGDDTEVMIEETLKRRYCGVCGGQLDPRYKERCVHCGQMLLGGEGGFA